MKEENNITQLYQDAFKDFAVEAPASTYAKVQNQLGRKSLLTLDPTRLNVYYIALMSGVVAWALFGTGSEPLVENELPESKTEILANENKGESINTTWEEEQNTDNTVVNSLALTAIEEVEQHSVKENIERQDVSKKSFVKTNKKTVLALEPLSDLDNNQIKSIPVLEIPEKICLELPNEIEVVVPEIRTWYTVDKSKVEEPKEFLRALGLSSSGSTSLTIHTKASSKK